MLSSTGPRADPRGTYPVASSRQSTTSGRDPLCPDHYCWGFSCQRSGLGAGSENLQSQPEWGHVRTQPGWRRRGAQGLWASRPCPLNSVNLPLCSITVCHIDYDIWLPSINLTGFSKDFPFCLPAEGDGGGINIEIIGSVGATHSTGLKETKWSRRCNLKCHEGPNSESCQVLLYIQGS